MICIAVALLVVATYQDIRTREISDWISVALGVLALGAAAASQHPAGWVGLILGCATGFALGVIGFTAGGLGGGDVKLCTGLGAVLGPWGLLSMLFWVALAGGLLAVVAIIRGQRDLAFVPAITLGMLIHVVWPNATAQVLGI